MDQSKSLRRPLLYSLVGAVVIGAVLGIFVVLRNEWSWFEIRVMLTTVTIAAASLCGLACDLSKTPRGANLLPKGGLLLTLVAAVLILVGIWFDVDAEEFWKAVTSVSILAVATVHVSLLSIARLAGRFRWVYLIACQVIYGLAMLLIVMIIWEIDDDEMIRFVAAVSIVDAALTLVIPLLHRISRTDAGGRELLMPLEERSVAAIDQEIAELRKRIQRLEKLRTELAGE